MRASSKFTSSSCLNSLFNHFCLLYMCTQREGLGLSSFLSHKRPLCSPPVFPLLPPSPSSTPLWYIPSLSCDAFLSDLGRLRTPTVRLTFECSRTTDDTGNFRCEIPLSLTSFANPLQIELLLSYKGLNPVGFLLVLKTDTQNWPTLHNQIFTIRFSSHLCPGEPSWAVGVKKASSQLLHSSLLESARPRYSQVSLKRQNDPPDLLSPRHQGPQLTRLGYRLLFLPFVPSPFNQLNISDASHTWSFSSFIPYTTEHSQSPQGP